MSCGNRAKASVIWSKFRSINGFILRNWGACVDTVFCTCQNDRSGLIGKGKVTVYSDSRWKPACKDGCRQLVVVDGKVDLDLGVADEVGGVIVDADEGRLEA